MSSLVESSTQLAFITDTDGQIIYANPACVQMLGYSTDDLYAFLYGALFDLTDDQRARLDQCATQKIPCLLKTQARRADGTAFSVHLAASPLGGQPDAQGMVVFASDTSGLEQAEEKLRLILDHAFDGISLYRELVDGTRVLVDCNRRYAEMAGQTRDALLEIGNTLPLQKSFGPIGDRGPFLTAVQTGHGYQGRFSWVRPDGRDNVIEYNAMPIQVDGQVLTIGLDRDITERKQMDQALGYRLMMEELVTAVSTRFIRVAQEDIENEIRLALQAMGEFVGVDRCYLHLFSDDLQAIERAYEWSAAGIEPREEALTGLSTGHMAWAMEKKKRMETMHARQRAEQEKKDLERELGRARLMESLGLLAGGVAHDLNNLLGSPDRLSGIDPGRSPGKQSLPRGRAAHPECCRKGRFCRPGLADPGPAGRPQDVSALPRTTRSRIPTVPNLCRPPGKVSGRSGGHRSECRAADMGYKVTAVASGRAAVDHLSNHTVDIVILDMLIEDDFDGLDTYREITRIHPGQKAVIASGFSETARVKAAQQLGAGTFLRKPYTLYRLGEAVREELDRGTAGQQAQSWIRPL